MVRILLTGANGQLGRELRRQLADRDAEVTPTTRTELDITDAEQVEGALKAGCFDLVINAAAYTAVDKAESDEEEAFRVNADAPGCLARLCATYDAVLIHISTDYVFDGKKDSAYSEEDLPCPANAYGRSKEAGERAIREALDRHLILRTSWLFSAHCSNFVKTMLRLAAEQDELKVVDDQWGNPTSASDLAWCIAELVGKSRPNFDHPGCWGTYHCTNRGAVTWCGFAEAIMEEAGRALGHRPIIQAITTADYPTPASRPLNSRLDCGKLERTFGIAMPSWRPSLSQVVAQILDVRTQTSIRGQE